MEQTLREPEPASHMEMEEEIIISTSATLASDSLKLVAAHRSNTQKSENMILELQHAMETSGFQIGICDHRGAVMNGPQI
jgi:ABC-type transport system involved in cytochrome bd biosynthesis fused ATPase/permease subunit